MVGKFYPGDIQSIPFNLSWWSNSTVVVTRLNGCISIHSAVDGVLSQVAETEWAKVGFHHNS